MKGHERAGRLFCSIGPGRIQCGVEVTGAANTRQYAQWAAHARRYKGTRTTKLCRSDRLISSPDTRPTTSAAQATRMGSAKLVRDGRGPNRLGRGQPAIQTRRAGLPSRLDRRHYLGAVLG